MKKYTCIFLLMLCALAAVSCSRDGMRADEDGPYSDVFIYCALGYNNLSGYLLDNLEDMKGGVLPERVRDKAVVAYCHNTLPGGGYDTPNPPVLLRLYRDKGRVHTDTLKVYSEHAVGASADAIHEMLLDVREMFPSESYGMLFSSHASGWMPVGYSPRGENPYVRTLAEFGPDPSVPLPLTKTMGAYYDGSSSNSIEIDVQDFAAAIPMHLDYLILDACMLGCVEVAWEFRNVCDMVAFSPTEVLAQGFVYDTMVMNLLGGSSPDVEKVCREYFEQYDSKDDGLERSATVSLVDCSKLDRLASAFAAIIEDAGENLPGIDRNSVQKYFYNSKMYYFYYDLRDPAAALSPDPALLAELDSALDDCVVYHAETPSFFNLELERCCGLSVYFPSSSWPVLNGYYRTLGWNHAVGLVD